MLDQASISRLYANVLHNDIVVNAVPAVEIRAAVQCMANVYMKNADFKSSVLEFPNYNDIACRCAYLHKYAPLHTYIVLNVMMRILQKEMSRFRKLLVNVSCFNFCSLGGGPGSDVVGVLCALKLVTSSFNSSVTIIDCMEKWGITFKSVLQELKFGGYGTEWQNLANHFDWNYIGANLLCSMNDEVRKSIALATFITMIKFVSASTCTNTEEMVSEIFRAMKPGALVLYIDNAAGGFTQIVERAGKRHGLQAIYGPERHVEYDVEALKIERFGYTSCFRTRVTIILLQKTSNNQLSRRNMNNPDQNAIIAKSPDSLDFRVLNNNNSSSNSKMVNTIKSDHPPKSINQTVSVAKPRNPVSTPTIEKNRTGISKSNSNSLPPTASNINDLSARLDNANRGLQKPNAAVGQTARSFTTIKPRGLSSDVNSSRAAWPNTSQSSIPKNSAAASNPRTPNVSAASNPRPNVSAASIKYPTRSPPTTDRRAWQSVPSSAARLPSNAGANDRSLRETNGSSEEICCSCCTIS